jgi:hypothetical protein
LIFNLLVTLEDEFEWGKDLLANFHTVLLQVTEYTDPLYYSLCNFRHSVINYSFIVFSEFVLGVQVQH